MIKRIRELLKLNEKQETLQSFGNSVDWQEFGKWAYQNIPSYIMDADSSVLGDLEDKYAEENDIELGEVIHDSNFVDWLYSEIAENLTEAYDIVERAVGNLNPIPVYRALRIKGDYIEHLQNEGKHLGVYWTWDQDSATDYEGSESSRNTGGDFYLIGAEVPSTSVNWGNTILQNWISESEQELQLYKGVPINIKRIWKAPLNRHSMTYAVELEVPEEIKNKTFFA